MTYASRLLLLLALSAAFLAGCEDEAGTPTATAGPSASASASPTSSAPPVGTSTVTGTATATPDAGTQTPTSSATLAPTAVATPEVTPAPVGPVASTFTVPTSELPVVRFTSAGGRTADLPVEVPLQDEYGIGLSGRASLEGRGMVFYYPEETGAPGFWMRGTFVDLDIAFVALDGTIIQIDQMEAETEDMHHPGRAYLAGIEAPLGWYAEHGIEAGDRFEFLFDPATFLWPE